MESTAENRLDMMTGLPTRAQFDTDLSAQAGKKSRDPKPLSLAVADIDLFGAINESHGRGGGDAVIRLFAEELSSHLEDGATLYRFGGDALALLLPDVEKEQAFLLLEQFRASFSEARKIDFGSGPVATSVTVSMGLATFPDDGGKPSDVLNKANEALYRAKVSGRNKICLAREEKMVTKTSHYMQGQLMGLRRLAEREKIGEALLLREALNDLLRKHNA